MITEVELQDRFRGALVGTAVGDALGAPVEGHPHVPRDYVESIVDNPPNLSYTDDTAMTLGLAESLVACGRFDGAHMAEILADRYRKEPWRGYGAGPPQVFADFARGIPWDQAAKRMFGGEGSFGNGAGMRVAPAALYAFPNQHEVAEIARQTALITHAHPEGVDGAVMQAVAITVVLGPWSNSPTEITSVLLSHVQTPVFRSKLTFIDRHIRERPLDEIAEVLGTGIAAHASVPTALACFLTHSDSFPEAIKAAISLGGDTDTIAAMTGALAGANHGYSAIPQPWRAVEDAGQLIALADSLLACHQSE
ncbi:MAG TPA: ADP-ribosylglycohydrolase family protein [Acidimicrobiia bacterium]|nr:ADP-ribosylglycohydrolase family protein [Acidimicrobiia bacterium]